MSIDIEMQQAGQAYDRWLHREQQDACTDHDDTPYPGLPDATWDDIEECLDDILPETIWEAIGPDGLPEGEFKHDSGDHRARKIFQAIALDDEVELGRLIIDYAKRYVVEVAQKRLELRAHVKSDLSDLVENLLS